MPDESPVMPRSRLSAPEVAHRSFTTVRRGADPEEVRSFLSVVAEELVAAEQREEELEAQLAVAEDQVLHPDIDEAMLSAALGQRSAAVLRSAHEEAARIVQEAEETAAALVRDAHQAATDVHVRAEATAAERIAEAEIAANTFHQQARKEAAAVVEAARAEGERIVDKARDQGRTMLDQAQEARRRVLADMAERRRAMTAQIDQYRAARDELATAVLGVRQSVDRIVDDLSRADDVARAAAAQAAHRHTAETTEGVLVAEAERAAAEIGARTGTPADLEAAAATRPLSLEDIRTAVPPGGQVLDEPRDEAGLGAGEPGQAAGEPEAAAGQPWYPEEGGTVDDETAPTDPGRSAWTAPLTSPVPEDLAAEREAVDVAPGVRVTAPRAAEAAADTGVAGAGEEEAPSRLGDELGDAEPLGGVLGQAEPLGGGVFEGESFAGDVFAARHFDTPVAGGVEPPPAGDAEPGAGGGAAPGGGSDAGVPDDDIVEGLFARLRASREAAEHAEATDRATDAGSGTSGNRATTTTAERRADRRPAKADAAPEVAETDVAAGPAPTPMAGEALTRRTELLGPISAVLARRLKRALQDDQNRLLERLRSGSGAWSDDLLPDEADQRALYARAARPQVLEAMAAGITYARSVGKPSRAKAPAPDGSSVDEIANELGATVVALLRRRLSGEGIDDPTERVGAAYREWRGERIERLVGDCAVEAFSAGVLVGVPDGTGLRWVCNEASAGCADCEDNALGGKVGVGEEFPTGHRYPPAHAGCRCIVLPTPT